jgi:hypothetical protein
MYLGASGTCLLNPPCEQGGTIDVNGLAVTLAPDVEIAGVGDNRIASRNGTQWYSVYAMPADFIVSGQTPEALKASWDAKLQQAGVPGTGPAQAGIGSFLTGNTLVLLAVAGGLFLLFRRKGR